MIKTPLGEVRQHAPQSYINGRKVNSHFYKYADGAIGIVAPERARNEAITIDPSVSWATYFGGAGSEVINTVRASGNGVYIVGTTASASGIADSINTVTHSYKNTLGGSTDIFFAKFDTLGNAKWATYYGGSAADLGLGAAVDPAGNLYVAGSLGGGTGYSTIGTYQGAIDAMLIKFGPTGTRLWAVDYGGTSGDLGTGCSVDTINGFVYLSGMTKSKTGIATTGAHKTDTTGVTANYDAFLAQFNTSGILQWATYYGGLATESNPGTVVDGSGNVYLAGTTTSNSGIASPSGVFQDTLSGITDIFLSKFNSSGAWQWGTYFGGTSNTSFPNSSSTNGTAGIAIAGNRIYMAGRVNTNGIGTTGTYQSSYSGSFDGFLACFSTNGSKNWCTYYGYGTGTTTYGTNCAPDGLGGAYLVGYTSSTTGIATVNGPDTSFSGGYDGFIADFDSTGVRKWGSYYGGTDTDYIYTCTTDGNRHLYVAGSVKSTAGIATSGAYQAVNGGGFDGLLAQITDPLIFTDSVVPFVICAGATVTVPFTAVGTFNAGNIFTLQLSDASGIFGNPVNIGTYASTAPSGTITAVVPATTLSGATYRVRVVSSKPSATGASDPVNITIGTAPAMPAAIIGNNSVCSGLSYVYAVTAITNATSYIWTIPSGWSGSSTTDTLPVISGAAGGAISVMSNSTCGSSAAQTLIVNVSQPVVPSASITVSPAASIFAGDIATFQATVVNGGTNPVFQWRKNGSNILGATSATYVTDTLHNNDVISLWMQSDTCSNPDTVISNKITMSVSVGIPTTTSVSNEIKVYPNPGNGHFSIAVAPRLNGDDKMYLDIIDQLGRCIYKKTFTLFIGQVNTETVDLGSEPKTGIYTLHISDNNGSYVTPLIIRSEK